VVFGARYPLHEKLLRKAYVEERVFYGGRGPSFVHEGTLTYVNTIEAHDFADFRGHEDVFNIDGQQSDTTGIVEALSTDDVLSTHES